MLNLKILYWKMKKNLVTVYLMYAECMWNCSIKRKLKKKWFELNIDRFLLFWTKTLCFFITFTFFKLLPFKEGVELSFPPKSEWMVSLLVWQKQKFIWTLQTCNFWWKHKHTRPLSCKVSLYSDNPSTPSYCMPLQVRGALPNCLSYSNVKCAFSKVS